MTTTTTTITQMYVGRSNGHPVDILFKIGDDSYSTYYSNRISTVMASRNPKDVMPVDGSKLTISARVTDLKEGIPDAMWAEVPQAVKTLFNWENLE